AVERLAGDLADLSRFHAAQPGAGQIGVERMYTPHQVPWTPEQKQVIDEILYADEDDGDPYRWLEQLAGYAPIIHLQQTDGSSSKHLPFNETTNAGGTIDAGRVLEANGACYEADDSTDTMPPKVKDIYLTIEVFSATAEKPPEIRKEMTERLTYSINYILRDGLLLDKLVTQSKTKAL
ncbi:MAG: hypothetical protein ACOC8L_13095, partial [Spirochaetota bacterium]